MLVLLLAADEDDSEFYVGDAQLLLYVAKADDVADATAAAAATLQLLRLQPLLLCCYNPC